MASTLSLHHDCKYCSLQSQIVNYNYMSFFCTTFLEKIIIFFICSVFRNLLLFLPKYSNGSVKHLSSVVFRRLLLPALAQPSRMELQFPRLVSSVLALALVFWDFPFLLCRVPARPVLCFSFLGLSLHFIEPPLRQGGGTLASLKVGVRQKVGEMRSLLSSFLAASPSGIACGRHSSGSQGGCWNSGRCVWEAQALRSDGLDWPSTCYVLLYSIGWVILPFLKLSFFIAGTFQGCCTD